MWKFRNVFHVEKFVVEELYLKMLSAQHFYE